MLVFGGCADNRVWKLDLNTNRWSVLAVIGEAPRCRQYHVAELTDRNTMLIFGGQAADNTSTFLNDVAELDLSDGNWHVVNTTGPQPSGRMCSTSMVHNNVLCVLVGGSNVFHNECFELNLRTQVWRSIPNSPVAVTRPTTVRHRDRVVMWGGCVEGHFRQIMYTMRFRAMTLKELCRQWITDHHMLDDGGRDAVALSELPYNVSDFLHDDQQ
jgi:hypothetical protein